AIQRKTKHGRIRSQPGNLACGLKPVHDRHLQVQYHDVGVQFFDAFNRYLAVVCLATNYPMGVLLDTRAKRTAYRGVVVNDENGIWHVGPGALGMLRTGPRRTGRRTATRKDAPTLLVKARM